MNDRSKNPIAVAITALICASCAFGAWGEDQKPANDAKPVTGIIKPVNPDTQNSKEGLTRLEKKVIVERALIPTKELYTFPEGEKLIPKIEEKGSGQGLNPTPPPSGTGYRIGASDVLAVQIFDDPALSRETAVRYDGFISLPQIPDIQVGGLTRAEAEQRVRDAYSAVLRNPRLNLTVNKVESKNFIVMGDVQRPGEYPYKRPISLLEAMETAGGLRVDLVGGNSNVGAQGQLVKAFIIRHAQGEREVQAFDLRGLRNSGSHPSDAPVYAGDIVYVPEGMNLVYVMGEARFPNVFPLLENMTVLQLLARAGGANEPTARMRSVMLLRQKDAKTSEAMMIDLRKALDTGFSPELEPGDIIYIPRGKLVRLHDNLMRFTHLTDTVSPILGLYQQAFDAYYTPAELRHVIHGGNGNNTAGSALGLLQTAAQIGLLVKP